MSRTAGFTFKNAVQIGQNPKTMISVSVSIFKTAQNDSFKVFFLKVQGFYSRKIINKIKQHAVFALFLKNPAQNMLHF